MLNVATFTVASYLGQISYGYYDYEVGRDEKETRTVCNYVIQPLAIGCIKLLIAV